MTKRIRTRAPYYRLRQTATRVLTVFERHKAHPMVALFEDTLVPTTKAFIAQFDATHAFEVARPARAMAQTTAARHAWARTSMWLAFLERDAPAFDASQYTSDPDSVVAVIAAAERLVAFATDLEAGGTKLPYAAQMRDDLHLALRAATTHWNEARASLNELQTRQADTRKQAVAFERELIAFRRALKVLLGESNTDYQSLRATRRATVTESGTADAPVEPITTPNANANGASAANSTFTH